MTLNNLAAIHHSRGRLPLARKLYGRSLEMKRRLLGDNHPDVALSYYNLAVLQVDLRQPDQAAASLRTAIHIFSKACGARHPHTMSARKLAQSLRKSTSAAS